MILKEEFQFRFLSMDYDQTSRFSVAQWKRLPDAVFLAWRTLWSAWHVVWMSVSLWSHTVYESDGGIKGGSKWLIFLTNWSYLLLTLQSLLHLAITLHKRCPHQGFGLRRYGTDTEVHPIIYRALWLVTSVSFTAAVDVTIFFWVFDVRDPRHYLPVYSVMVHAVNSVYVITDMLISASPVRLLHFIYPVIYAIIYLLFSVVFYLAHGTDAEGHPFIYQELNWQHPGPVASFTLASILTVVPSTHTLLYGLYRLRVCVHERCCATDGEESDEETPRTKLNTGSTSKKEYKTMF